MTESISAPGFCLECGAARREGTKFCAGCGAAYELPSCRACGANNTAGARFCRECGETLAIGHDQTPSPDVEVSPTAMPEEPALPAIPAPPLIAQEEAPAPDPAPDVAQEAPPSETMPPTQSIGDNPDETPAAGVGLLAQSHYRLLALTAIALIVTAAVWLIFLRHGTTPPGSNEPVTDNSRPALFYIVRPTYIRDMPTVRGSHVKARLGRGDAVSGVMSAGGEQQWLKISEGPYQNLYLSGMNISPTQPPALTRGGSGMMTLVRAEILRSIPDQNAPAIETVSAGTNVSIAGEVGAWVEILRRAGGVGYLPLAALVRAQPSADNRIAAVSAAPPPPPAALAAPPAAPSMAADWPEFWSRFRAAVASKDKTVLGAMMTSDMDIQNSGGRTRLAALRSLTCCGDAVWSYLRTLVSAPARPGGSGSHGRETVLVSVAKACPGCVFGLSMTFERDIANEWRWTSLSFPGD